MIKTALKINKINDISPNNKDLSLLWIVSYYICFFINIKYDV
jgi:hypothetical protein